MAVDKTQFLVPAIRDAFAARLMALPDADSGDSEVIPNPIPPAENVATATSLKRDTGTSANFSSFTTTNDLWEIRALNDDAGTYVRWRGLGNAALAIDHFQNGQGKGDIASNAAIVGAPLTGARDLSFAVSPEGVITFTINGQEQAGTGLNMKTNGFFAAYRQGRFLDIRGSSAQPLTDITIGAYNLPLQVTNVALDGDGYAIWDIYYTGSPPGYDSRIETSSGTIIVAAAPAVLVSNPSKGVARYKAANRLAGPGSGVHRLTLRGSPGVSLTRKLIRPQPLLIGQNTNTNGFPSHTNMVVGNTVWQDRSQYLTPDEGYRRAGQGYIGPDGNIRNMPAGVAYNLRVTKPAAVGAVHEVSWVEPNNSTGTSRFNTYGSSQGDQFWSSQTSGYTGGRFWFRGTPQINMASPVDQMWIVFNAITNGAETSDIRCAEVGADFSKRLRTQYLDTVISPLRGWIRTMEDQSINGWGQDYAWADRPRPGFGEYANFYQGIPLEDIIAKSRHSDRDLQFIIGPKWPESTVKGAIRALFTGEGMANGGVGIRPGVKVHLTLCGNEPWNSTFTGLWQWLVQQARDRNEYHYNNNGSIDENKMRIYQQVRIHNRNLQWIREAIPEYLDRITIAWNCNQNGHYNDWIVGKEAGLAGVDIVESSIYVGIGVKHISFGGNSAAELYAPWLADADAQVNAALQHLGDYAAEGIRRTIYEIGMDNFQGTGMSQAEAVTWSGSDEYIAVYRHAWERVAAEMGDSAAIYMDCDPLHQWGHYQPGVPTPKWDLIQAIQAEVDGVN